MRRRVYFTCAALAFYVALLCGCQAAGSLFDVPEPKAGEPVKEAPIQTIIREAADSTGNPLIAAAGAVAAALVGAFLGKKGAKTDTANAIATDQAKPWTTDEADDLLKAASPDVLAAVLRAAGLKVERAA